MPYSHRLGTAEDTSAIAPLMSAFAQERSVVDPSMVIKPGFDFEKYVAYQLSKPLSYCWVLEHCDNEQTEQRTIVGCLFIYFYDEAPPSGVPEYLIQQHAIENPFLPRRVVSVLGLYVQPEHRQPEAIKLLTDAGIQKAEEMKVTDIDLLIAEDQTGIQALLKRSGFRKAAVQYTRHYTISPDAELPSLHPSHPELDLKEAPAPSAIPLRDPKTNELVYNPKGEPVFLSPLQDKTGKLLTTSDGLPIYPTPVRDPQTPNWVFDTDGELVICPMLRDDEGRIIEHNGIPQFHPPAYQSVQGTLHLKQDGSGKYVFCDVERDKEGKIMRSPTGQPVFQQPLQK